MWSRTSGLTVFAGVMMLAIVHRSNTREVIQKHHPDFVSFVDPVVNEKAYL